MSVVLNCNEGSIKFEESENNGERTISLVLRLEPCVEFTLNHHFVWAHDDKKIVGSYGVVSVSDEHEGYLKIELSTCHGVNVLFSVIRRPT